MLVCVCVVRVWVVLSRVFSRGVKWGAVRGVPCLSLVGVPCPIRSMRVSPSSTTASLSVSCPVRIGPRVVRFEVFA